MSWFNRMCFSAALLAASACALPAQGKRKVIIDQDAAGPGGTDMQSILALVNRLINANQMNSFEARIKKRG